MGGQNGIRFRLSNLRESRGLTKAYIADNVLHLSLDQYSKMETGSRGVNTSNAIALADFYGVSCDYILRGVQAGNVDICKRTGLTQESIDMLESHAQERKKWKDKEDFHKAECERLKTTLKKSDDSTKVVSDNPNLEDLFEHEDRQWEAESEFNKCVVFEHILNAFINNDELFESLADAGTRAVENSLVLYAQTHSAQVYETEIEDIKDRIDVSKYKAVTAFAKFFEDLCSDVDFVTCAGHIPVPDSDVPKKLSAWLEYKNKTR